MIGLPSQALGHVLCHYITTLGVDVTAEVELRDIGADRKVSLEELSKKVAEVNLGSDAVTRRLGQEVSAIVEKHQLAWLVVVLLKRTSRAGF